MSSICEVCQVNAAQPDTFLCEECTLRMEVPLEGEGVYEPMEEDGVVLVQS
jgi:hypothetical protein